VRTRIMSKPLVDVVMEVQDVSRKVLVDEYEPNEYETALNGIIDEIMTSVNESCEANGATLQEAFDKGYLKLIMDSPVTAEEDDKHYYFTMSSYSEEENKTFIKKIICEKVFTPVNENNVGVRVINIDVEQVEGKL